MANGGGIITEEINAGNSCMNLCSQQFRFQMVSGSSRMVRHSGGFNEEH